MSAATLVAWRKKPGDTIERGDVIALVETGKRLIDIEAFTTGVLEKILVEPGATVPTGTVLAIIRNGVSAEAAVTAAPGPPSPAAAPAVASAVPAAAGRIRISPLARKLAAQLGVDPTAVPRHGAGRCDQAGRHRAGGCRERGPGSGAAARGSRRQARLRQAVGAAMARSS